MRSKLKKQALLLAAISTLGVHPAANADTSIPSFTPGDLVLLRGGDATNPNGGSTETIGAYLDEYTPAGAYVGTIEIPQAASGSNNALTLTAGGGTHEGGLTLSPNGNWLTFGGYDTSPTTSLSGPGVSNDTVGEISQSASTLNTSTVIGKGTIRSAITVDGNEFYVWNAPGIQYVSGIGSSAVPTTLSGSYDARGFAIADNTLIGGTGSASIGTHGVYQLGTTGTLPTTSIPSTTLLTGSSAQSGSALVFANEPDDSLTSNLYLGKYNVLYTVGGSGSLPTINKYEFNGITFTFLNSESPAGPGGVLYGVTYTVSGSNIDLDYTDGTGIFQIVDSNKASSPLPNNGALLGTDAAPSGQFYYGIALAPTAVTSSKNLTWNNTGGTGNGTTWDTTSQDWDNGSAATTFSSSPGDNVTFDDSSGLNHYSVSIASGGVTAGTITVNTAQPGGYTFTGTGGIGGGKGLTLTAGTLTLANTGGNSYGSTSVNGGTLNIEAPGALPANSILFVAPGASVNVNRNGGSGRIVLNLSTLTNNGLIDLQDNDLIIHNVDAFTAQVTLSGVFTQLQSGYAGGAWNGTSGIISSTAANSDLFTLGEATGVTGVDGVSIATDVVVKLPTTATPT